MSSKEEPSPYALTPFQVTPQGGEVQVTSGNLTCHVKWTAPLGQGEPYVAWALQGQYHGFLQGTFCGVSRCPSEGCDTLGTATASSVLDGAASFSLLELLVDKHFHMDHVFPMGIQDGSRALPQEKCLWEEPQRRWGCHLEGQVLSLGLWGPHMSSSASTSG